MLEYQGEKFKKWLDEMLLKEKEKPKDERLTVGKVREILGISNTAFYSLFNSKNLTRESVNRITEKLNVSEEEIWGDDKVEPNVKPAHFSTHGSPNMWIVPIKAQGGFLSGYGDQVYLEGFLDKVYFPFVKGQCFAFEIEGESMINEYMPRNYFIGSPIEGKEFLVKDRVYTFQTIDGIILKCYDRMDDEFMYLYSLNEEYNPVPPIPLKNVKKIYQKEGYLEL